MTGFDNLVGLVVRNKAYQRARARHMLLREEAKIARLLHEQLDDRAELIKARRLELEANAVAREMADIAEALARKTKPNTAAA